MNTLTITLAAGSRRCDVDAAELEAWSRALLDDLLLAAAIAAGERPAPDATPLTVSQEFRISVDANGALRVER